MRRRRFSRRSARVVRVLRDLELLSAEDLVVLRDEIARLLGGDEGAAGVWEPRRPVTPRGSLGTSLPLPAEDEQ